MAVITNVLHPWHGATTGENAPSVVNGIIEIPEASRIKYEIDKPTGLLKLDRVLFGSTHYPSNYGFIPQTLGEDNDPLDILILAAAPITSLCLVEAKVIGVMHMIDGGEGDDKIIAVANDDCTVAHINELSDVPQQKLNEIQNFFETYKLLEKKEVIVSGFEGKEVALEIIEKSIVAYKEKYVK
ncbi:inorganic diphosphatase [Rhizosphaericola mali]|uniref:Inorganic pyrophosphatase n=1 Tax=Rhizosphaericola mali TaxID=2545455 RepID=A0A5P2FW94_9BACT|nr:inorganic diphosphatase [Rhizosphaericola mali]QES87157.1 inorganic diphosphatase [Rhizosphaericola mali]